MAPRGPKELPKRPPRGPQGAPKRPPRGSDDDDDDDDDAADDAFVGRCISKRSIAFVTFRVGYVIDRYRKRKDDHLKAIIGHLHI